MEEVPSERSAAKMPLLLAVAKSRVSSSLLESWPRKKCFISASPPLTMGAAKEVPARLSRTRKEPGEGATESNRAAVMPVPGAAMHHGPAMPQRLESSAILMPRSTATTTTLCPCSSGSLATAPPSRLGEVAR